MQAQEVVERFRASKQSRDKMWCVCRWMTRAGQQPFFCGPLGFAICGSDRTLGSAFFPNGKISTDLFLTHTQEEAELAIASLSSGYNIGLLRPVPISALDWGVSVYSNYDGSKEELSFESFEEMLKALTKLEGIASTIGACSVNITCKLRRIEH